MEYLVLNWFIQMKYLLAQIKIIIISCSLTKVINGIFILFLVIFGTYQIICQLFVLRSTIESLVVSCSA